ncbi:transketolase [Malaciobacter molluscorum]|uniref:transketolase n=1 Tax=Malaciobacter molluscorum TaxID=1032072 RepID=UPI00100A330E|nr:transketolase [Malaciobacter molluscorum]RXJ93839.1 transketolase [Malaciobacter molluscorum]
MTNLVSKQEVMEEIYNYFEKDKKMVLLAGDMGFSVLDLYFLNYENRTFNTGINEQATVGMAAGMSMTGLKPIIYSQIPFITMRAFEQLRYDVNEHKLNIKIVGVGANNYFKMLGRSHCMDEDDIQLISLLKNILIISPSKDTLKKDIKKALDYNGPVYLRSL